MTVSRGVALDPQGRSASVGRASAAASSLFSAHALWPDSPVFTTGELVEFERAPHRGRLRKAIDLALAEADGMRAVFHATDDPAGPVGFELTGTIPILEIDLGSDRTALDDHARTVATTVFDPLTGPCAQVQIVTAGDRTALILLADHIVIDAYAHALLINRIAALYADPSDDRRLHSILSLTPDSGAPYDAPREDDARFWELELADVTGPLTLADQPRGHRIATSVRTRTVNLDARRGPDWVPRFTACVAAWCARRTGSADVVLGFPLMNRLGSPAARVITTTVNVAPLSVPVASGDTIDDLSTRCSEAMARIAPHGRHRGEQIVADLRRRGIDGAVGPAVNIKPFSPSADFDGITAHIRSLARGPVVDMSLTTVHLDEDNVEVVIDADADLYSDADLDQIVASLVVFAEHALSPESGPIGALRIGRDGTDVIAELEAAAATGAPARPIIERILANDPAWTALRHGEHFLTYAEIDSRSAGLAGRLGALSPEDTVAVLMPRGFDLVISLLAVLRAGGAFLPLDPAFPAERIAMIVEDAAPIAVIEPGEHSPIVRRVADPAPGSAPHSLQSSAHPYAPAYLLYTSGSTGRPKGVVIGHRALDNFTESMIRLLDLDPTDVLLAVTTASFDISILELLVPLASGTTVVLAGTDDVHDPSILADLIERHGVTTMQATPSLWAAMLDAGHSACLSGIDVLVGGEQLPPELADALVGCARSVRNMYGPTETTIWSTTAEVVAGAPVSIGTAIDNTGIRILDATLTPVAVGEVGELYLTGDGLARGYRGRPDLTAKAFTADPFGPAGTRMYRTGDLARLTPELTLECLGRTDHQVKIRGFRIELGDVESALILADGVGRAVAKAIDGRLIGYVTPASDATAAIDVDDVRACTSRQLPDYMVPSTVIVIDEFPLTPNGKIDRRALPEPDFAAMAGLTRAPAAGAEADIAAAFAEVLHVGPLGADDDFFRLGGDSLSAVRLVTAAAERGHVITALDVFDHPTPAALARLATPRAPEPATALAPSAASGTGSTGIMTAGLHPDELDDLLDGDLL